jgi:splicing factor 3B subunit 2
MEVDPGQIKGSKRRSHHRAKRKPIQSLQIPDLLETQSVGSLDINEFDPEFSEILARFDSVDVTHQPFISTETQSDPLDEYDSDISISRQQIRKFGRPSIAVLKSISRRPELIEPHDTDAPDPFTLTELKTARNVIPVPSHWSQKRRYLNYKKGTEMSRYRLPAALEKTGIPKVRQSLREIDEKKSLQQRQRDRAKPKLGMFDMSSESLRLAFFKEQKKPFLTRFGDVYFEGKELKVNSREIRPGFISEKLREALGMLDLAPPPWLAKMQKIGPPPSYPNLKIPGLNAPLPKGCVWGNHIGGWGQVPVDDQGNPCWGGNPFARVRDEGEGGKKELWGVLKRSEGVEDGVNL